MGGDMVFTTKHQRNVHRARVHFPDRNKCKICQITFAGASSLRRHNLIHTDERNISCDECGKKFRDKADLADHKRMHAGVKNYACQYCPYASTTYSLLCHHKRRRHQAEYEEEKREKERAKIQVSKALVVPNDVESVTY